MKTLKLFSLLTLFISIAHSSFAQKTTSETFAVSGNCGMCKSKIETTAKEAGASFAEWSQEAKSLTVKFDAAKTSKDKIQKKIAEVGYDNAGYKATNAAYDNLHGCCKYERKATEEKACCAKGAEDKKADCCKKEDAPKKEEKCDKDCCKKG